MSYAVIVVGEETVEPLIQRGLTEGQAMKQVNDLIYKRLMFAVNVHTVTISVIDEDEYTKQQEKEN